MDIALTDLIFAGFAAFMAGIINALAGGGTLITFPVLTALGIPALQANVTSTIALSPGYLGGTLAQRKELNGQWRWLAIILPVGLIGGLSGGWLLLQTGEEVFGFIAPWLILLASFLLAVQPLVRKLIANTKQRKEEKSPHSWIVLLLFPASVYGGYFGAGVSVIIMAILGLGSGESVVRLNAVKQALAFVINVSTALFFIVTSTYNAFLVLVMAGGAIAGGIVGGKLAGKIRPDVLRWIIVLSGMVAGIVMLVNN
jgi:uncharacterized membrane protein YfcA